MGWSGTVILGLVVFGIIFIFFTRRGKHPPGLDVSSADGGPKCPASRYFLAIYGLAIFAIYSLIPYKTPWLALNFWLPMAWLAGMAVEWIWFATPRFPIRAVIAGGLLTLGLLLAHDTWRRVFVAPADENNPYAYAHTVEDLLGLPARIEELSKQKNWVQPRIAVVAADAWPLPWYLRKYSQVGYWQPGQTPGPADLYVTSPEAAEKMSGQLTNFNAEFFGIRPDVLILLWTPVPPKKTL